MHRRIVIFTAAAAAALATAPLVGQSAATTKRAAPTSAIPRMPDGHPDLQGMYDLATLTPVERRAGLPLVLSDEEAAKLEQNVAQTKDQGLAPIKGDRAAPPKGGDGSPGPYGNVGGYNNFWLDPGSHYTVVDGRRRASLIID